MKCSMHGREIKVAQILVSTFQLFCWKSARDTQKTTTKNSDSDRTDSRWSLICIKHKQALCSKSSTFHKILLQWDMQSVHCCAFQYILWEKILETMYSTFFVFSSCAFLLTVFVLRVLLSSYVYLFILFVFVVPYVYLFTMCVLLFLL